MNIRKNQANLSHSERVAFVNAVLTLKRQPSRINPPTASRYDDYVWTHLASMQDMTMTQPGWAHMGPAFLPWHRYLIRQFELDLQAIDPAVTLPYWDWTTDNTKDPKTPGSPWTEDFMGGDGNPQDGFHVITGQFAGRNGHWPLSLFDDGEPHDPFLRRSFGTLPSAVNLPTAQQVTDCLTETPFYIAPWRCAPNLMQPNTNATKPSFANRLEGWYGPGRIHNNVHLWVGGNAQGSMVWMSSPNDPIFFLHHCNIDRLWAQWQTEHPHEGYHPTGSGHEIGPLGHNLRDPMQPWGGAVTPKSVLDHVALGYIYDTERMPLATLGVRLAARARALPRVPFTAKIAFPRFGFAPGESISMITFSDIQAYLDAIAAKNGQIQNSPHGTFWRTNPQTDYQNFTTGQVPGVGIPIMDQTNPLQSPFYLILTAPNGYQGIPQMPEGGPFITDNGYQVTLADGTVLTGKQLVDNITSWLRSGFPK